MAVAIPLLIAGASSYFFTACSPEWIDDNSCIYLTIEGKVMVRDIANKKSTEICEVEPGETVNNVLGKWLKLSPKKDKFIIAYRTGKKDKQAIVFDFYSIDGKKIDVSKPIPIPVEKAKPIELLEPVPGTDPGPDDVSTQGAEFTNIHWSHDGKYILATLAGMKGSISYHVERKSHQFHKRFAYGKDDFNLSYPISPDGRTFVAGEVGGIGTLALIAMESGKTLHEFDIKNVASKISGSDPHVYLRPFWRENVFVHPLKDGELLIDVANKTLKFQRTEAMVKLREHALANNCHVVGVIDENLILEFNNESRGGIRGTPKTGFSVFNKQEKSREKLDGLSEVSLFSVSKSSNQQRTMVCGISANAKGQQAQAVILDAEAKVIDSFKYAVAREQR